MLAPTPEKLRMDESDPCLLPPHHCFGLYHHMQNVMDKSDLVNSEREKERPLLYEAQLKSQKRRYLIIKTAKCLDSFAPTCNPVRMCTSSLAWAPNDLTLIRKQTKWPTPIYSFVTITLRLGVELGERNPSSRILYCVTAYN